MNTYRLSHVLIHSDRSLSVSSLNALTVACERASVVDLRISLAGARVIVWWLTGDAGENDRPEMRMIHDGFDPWAEWIDEPATICDLLATIHVAMFQQDNQTEGVRIGSGVSDEGVFTIRITGDRAALCGEEHDADIPRRDFTS